MESLTEADIASFARCTLVLAHNRDTLIRNLNNELKKPLLEINYHLFFDNFSSTTRNVSGQNEASNILDFSDHKTWFWSITEFVVDNVSSFVYSDIIRNANTVSDLHNADFSNCEFEISKLWKLLILMPPSGNIVTHNTGGSPLNAASNNRISEAIGVIEFDLKYRSTSYLLTELVANLEKKINTALCNKSWYSTWVILKKLLNGTIDNCLAGSQELSELPEQWISIIFELRAITPIKTFMSYILELNIETTREAIQFNNSYNKYRDKFISDRLQALGNDPAPIEVISGLRLVSKDEAGVEKTKIIINSERPRIIPNQVPQQNSVGATHNNQVINNSTNQIFSYTLCTNLDQGLLVDLEHTIFINFNSKFKEQQDGSLTGSAECMLINDVDFYTAAETPTLQQKLNSRILIAALICEKSKIADGDERGLPVQRPTRRRSIKSVDNDDSVNRPPKCFKSRLANNLVHDSILKRVRIPTCDVNLKTT
ncbi:unnamed protein product [Wickerhamomyces anomalus]